MKIVLNTKTAAQAPGIPDRSEMGDISKLEELKGQLRNYVMQKHLAERAGPHTDFRVSTPEGLLSWAIPKEELPEPGEKRLALRQPLHSKEYSQFEGEIPEGYGKGTVEKKEEGKLMVTNTKGDPPEEIDFSIAGRHPERFKLKQTDGGRWLLIGTTPSDKPQHEKVKMDTVDDEELEGLLAQVSEKNPMSVKIDGALGLLKILKDKADVMSHRLRSDTGGPIIHSERIAPQLRESRDIPEQLQNRTFEGEIYASKDNKPLPHQQTSGLLNSTITNALKKQKEQDIDFKMALFDVLPRDMDDDKKDKLINLALETYPKFLTRPPVAYSPSAAKKMLGRVMQGKHPLSSEGVVFDTPEGKKKYKKVKETDVVAKDFTPGEGKYTGDVGAINYALTPEGPVVGRVGTGLSDELRKQIAENPEEWKDRVLRIASRGQYPSGAFRGPSLLSFHSDYGQGDWGPEIGGRMEKTALKKMPTHISDLWFNTDPGYIIKKLDNQKRWQELNKEMGWFKKPQVKNPTLVPMKGMRRAYGDKTDEALREAIKYNKDNDWGNAYPTKQILDKDFLNREVGLDISDKNLDYNSMQASAKYFPYKDHIRISPREYKKRDIYPEDPTGAVREELIHSTQETPDFEAIKDRWKGYRKISENVNKNDFDKIWMDYVLHPREIGHDLVDIKRNYFQNTGNLVTSPEEAEKALEWAKNRRNDEGIFHQMEKMKETAPSEYNKLRKDMIRVMPGLVKNRRQGMRKYSSVDIMDKILQNTDKRFVQRLLTNPPQVVWNDDGSISTHLMSHAETDNGAVAFPTMVEGDDGLKKLTMQKAMERAREKGEYLKFPSEEDAGYFAKNYKSVLPHLNY